MGSRLGSRHSRQRRRERTSSTSALGGFRTFGHRLSTRRRDYSGSEPDLRKVCSEDPTAATARSSLAKNSGAATVATPIAVGHASDMGIRRVLMLSLVTTLAATQAPTSSAAEKLGAPLSACALAAQKSSLVGKRVTLRAILTDASPHAVYFADRERPRDWKCIIDVGSMASGDDGDLWKVFPGLPGPGQKIEVLASGTLRTEIRDGRLGKRYRTYFLDNLSLEVGR